MRHAIQIMLAASLAIISQNTLSAEEGPFVNARFMTAPIALKIASAAEAECRQKGYQISVAVTDRYGNLLAFARNPLAGAHTITISEYKAYTAATFQGATIELSERLAFLKGTPKLSLVGGGVPVRIGGYMYGAVGVSGAPSNKTPGDVDHECANAGIDAIREDIEFGSD